MIGWFLASAGLLAILIVLLRERERLAETLERLDPDRRWWYRGWRSTYVRLDDPDIPREIVQAEMAAQKFTDLISRGVFIVLAAGVGIAVLSGRVSGAGLLLASLLGLVLAAAALDIWWQKRAEVKALRTVLPDGTDLSADMKHAPYRWLKQASAPADRIRALKNRYIVSRVLIAFAAFGLLILLMIDGAGRNSGVECRPTPNGEACAYIGG